MLVPQLVIKPGPSAVKVPSPDPWTAREVPTLSSSFYISVIDFPTQRLHFSQYYRVFQITFYGLDIVILPNKSLYFIFNKIACLGCISTTKWYNCLRTLLTE